jgi:hypothetical protein
MFIEATCPCCKNSDTSEFRYYDGSLGYEAYVCKKCGSYDDHFGTHPADTWSRAYVELPEVKDLVPKVEPTPPDLIEAQPNRKVVWK